LANWRTIAANSITSGDINGAVSEREKILTRIDGDPSPPY
jgi:hypothetical protein